MSPAKAASQAAPWGVELFRRHREDDETEAVPARDFLDEIPDGVAARIIRALESVADAPPPSFSGGGLWEAMHGDMTSYFEVRVDSQRIHYRLFCLLERDGKNVGLDGPSVVAITGKKKPFRTKLSKGDYRKVRDLGNEYKARRPRSVEK